MKKITAESVKKLEHRKYLSIKDAAEYISVHPETIRNYIKQGKLKARSTTIMEHKGMRFANIRILRSSLDKLLKEIKI